jgi:hypothetical protein
MRPARKASALSMTAALLAVGMAWTAGGSAQAQQPGSPPQMIIVRVFQLKPEMVTTFEDLAKNVTIPALKKAGQPWRATWASVTGSNNIRITVSPFADYADFDQAPGGFTAAQQRALGPDGWQIYLGKLRQTYVSQQTIVQALRPDLTLQSNSSAPPTLASMRTIQLLPGKGDEFTRFMTSEYVPAVKKAGGKDYWVYATAFGAPQGQFVFVRPASKYADMARGGALAALPAEVRAPINARQNALISSSEVNWYRYVPDLSYGMPAKIAP